MAESKRRQEKNLKLKKKRGERIQWKKGSELQ